MTLQEKFCRSITDNNLFSIHDQLLLAVSGGLDSVVLCELCRQSGFTFSIAHCNFQLRGEESERDEQFVRALGERYNVYVYVKKFDTAAYATTHKMAVQEAARTLRYEWFEELTGLQSPAPVLLTAHHADDAIETALMHYFRGTGLKGLTGIPVKNGYTRRPLLGFFKEELNAFAVESGLSWVEDSSNTKNEYTRNLFRNELLPAIEQVYPQVKNNLLLNIRRFTDMYELYDTLTSRYLQQLGRKKGNTVQVPVKQLLQLNNRSLIYALIHPYGFTEKQVDEVLKLANAANGQYMLSPDGLNRIIKNRHWFILCPVLQDTNEMVLIEAGMKTILFSAGQLALEEKLYTGQAIPPAATEAWLDTRQLQYPLILRKWQTGDYFYPLGMRKKKKISRFLIDQKLSKTDKENLWVLESNKRICWVLGMRIDDRFKLTGKGTMLTRISWLQH